MIEDQVRLFIIYDNKYCFYLRKAKKKKKNNKMKKVILNMIFEQD